MWITEVLQKLIPHLVSENSREYLLDHQRLKTIQIELFKHEKLSPEQIVRQSDDDFVNYLCELKIELDALLSKGIFAQQQGTLEKLLHEMNNVLSENVTYSQTQELRSGLSDLMQLNQAHNRRVRKKRSILRDLAIVVSLTPLIGYGVHWAIANYYQQALIDEVNFVYPENSYELTRGIYQTRQSVLDTAIEKFQDYYFEQHNYYAPNPLPLAYNVEVVEGLGVKIDPASDFAKAIESGRANPKALSDSNFILFRVFVRNIQTNNIVNQLRVEAERISGNTFPWNRLNVDSTLKFSMPVGFGEEPYLSLKLETEGAPALAVNLSISLDSSDPELRSESKHSFKMIRKSKTVRPNFDKRLTGYDPERPLLLYVSPQKKESLILDANVHKTPEQVETDMQTHDDVNTYMKEFKYIYFTCPDGGLTIFSWPEHLQSLLGAKRVGALKVNYSYELLNGKQITGEEKLPLAENNIVLDEGVEIDVGRSMNCIGGLVFLLAEDMLATAAGARDILGMVDAVALALMEKSKQASPVIAVEESILFDFESKLQSLQKSSNEIHILKDGEYVLFNIYNVNFEGGDYRFTFYFDDESVGEVTVNMLWPQSLQFKLGDEKYFRQIVKKVDRSD